MRAAAGAVKGEDNGEDRDSLYPIAILMCAGGAPPRHLNRAAAAAPRARAPLTCARRGAQRRAEERGRGAAAQLGQAPVHDCAGAGRGAHAQGAHPVPGRQQRRRGRGAAGHGGGAGPLCAVRRRAGLRAHAAGAAGDAEQRGGDRGAREGRRVAGQGRRGAAGGERGGALHAADQGARPAIQSAGARARAPRCGSRPALRCKGYPCDCSCRGWAAGSSG